MSFPELYCEKMRPNQLKISRSAVNQQTSMPANSDYGELVWENGQIVIKGGQSREVSVFPNKGSFINSKTGKSGSRLGFDEVVAGGEADSDMLSWFHHLDDDTLPHESTSGFSAEIFGVTSDVLPVSHTTVNKLSNPVKGSASVALDSKTERSDSLSLTYSGSEVSSVVGKGVGKYALQSDSIGDQLPELRLYKKQDKEAGCPLGGRSYSDAKNFPHFSWSAARSKNNLISDGARASGRFVTRETAAATEEMLVDTNDQTVDVMTKDLPGRPVERPANAFRAEGGLKVNQVSGNAQMERMDADMIKKPAAAAALPSVCSDNGGVNRLKRKHSDEEDWEDSSDDAEEESAIIKKVGSKRNRAAEVHNFTERKRRGKINEKMRALQDLIPYCNKVDKAAMLDEAIVYLRVLQLQVQMMSMRAQMYAPPMMAQPGLQHPHTTAPSSQFLPLGMSYQAGALDMTFGFPAQ